METNVVQNCDSVIGYMKADPKNEKMLSIFVLSVGIGLTVAGVLFYLDSSNK